MASMNIAWTPILGHFPRENRKHWTLGLVTRDQPGYTPIKETGDPADPLYMAKGPTRFATKEEAQAEATQRNVHEIGISEQAALEIVFSSIAAQNRGRVLKAFQ